MLATSLAPAPQQAPRQALTTQSASRSCQMSWDRGQLPLVENHQSEGRQVNEAEGRLEWIWEGDTGLGRPAEGVTFHWSPEG